MFAETDDVPAEVKDERKDEVMLLQQSINLRKNKELVGTTQRVLIDMCNAQGISLGRTYRDSPEIDNYVKIDEYVPTITPRIIAKEKPFNIVPPKI